MQIGGGVGSVVNAGTIAGKSQAIFLSGGGVVTNAVGASIAAAQGRAIALQGGLVTVANSGAIYGQQYGIQFFSTGTITNASTGTIKGGQAALFITYNNAQNNSRVLNSGTIYGSQTGVYFREGGVLTNAAGATISAQNTAVLAGGQPVSIGNAGTIRAASGTAVQFFGASNTLSNLAGGLVAGGSLGVTVIAGSSGNLISNAGVISGTTALNIAGAGSLTNQAGGLITGAVGVTATGGWTIINAGTIAGTTVAVSLGSGVTLIDNPGAVFTGKVVATGTADSLVLAAGTNIGTISQIGTQFAGFAAIREVAGARWTIAGSNALGATNLTAYGTLVNAGYLAGLATLGSGAVFTNTGQLYLGVVGKAANVQITNTGTLRGGGLGAVVALTAGGTLTNAAGGLISSSAQNGVTASGAPATIVNSGSIAARYVCVSLGAGGTVTNNAGGVLFTQYGQGVVVGNGGVVNNSGTINSTNSAGILLQNGKTKVFNFAGGFVSDIQATSSGTNIYNSGSVGLPAFGIILNGSGSNVFNLSGGTIRAGTAIDAYQATISNAAGGLIAGTATGIDFEKDGSIQNAGVISAIAATGTGVFLLATGTVTNLAGGVISGSAYGVNVYNSGQIFNSGTIGGSKYAVKLTGTGSVVAYAGAVFQGRVAANASFNDSLILASSTSGGTISGLGTSFTGFTTIRENAGATWTLAGSNSIGTATTFSTRGTLATTGTLTGRVTVAAGGTLLNSGRIAGNVTSTGGAVVNAAAGSIVSASGNAVQAGVAASVTNAGYILAQGTASGIVLAAGGSVVNAKGGRIAGIAYGVDVTGGSITNSGSITAFSTGVRLGAGTSLRNLAGGTITSGVLGTSGSVALYNNGLIGGGIMLAGGQVTNAVGGRVTSIGTGLLSIAAATIGNAGTIGGGTVGIDFAVGGTVTNAAGGSIAGGQYGVRIAGSNAAVVNAGTISGSKFAVLLSGDASTLTVAPQAVFSGVVAAKGQGSSLVLASSALAGTITNIGFAAPNGLYGFGTIQVASGAQWTLTGQNFINSNEIDVAGTLTNAGYLIGGPRLSAGAALYNTGRIGRYGIYGSGGPVTVTNSGTIQANSFGVLLQGGGTVTNNAGGYIEGSTFGVILGAYGTLFNAGAIDTSNAGGFQAGAVSLRGNDTVVVYPGARFFGGVFGYGGGNRLVLASAATAGTITNIGTIVGNLSGYTGFSSVTEASGATWTFAGANSLGSGTYLLLEGTANVTGTLQTSGRALLEGLISGNLTLGAGGSAQNLGTVLGTVALGGAGAYLTNLRSIAGSGIGVDATGAGTGIKNGGTITGGTNYGIDFAAGGRVDNGGQALVSGYLDGVFAEAAPATVFNSGRVIGSTRAGVYLKAGGTVTNDGTISGLAAGVRVLAGAGTVDNFGTIIGSAGNGVALRAGGNLSNAGSIGGSVNGVIARAAANIMNSGTISGFGAAGVGVYLAAGGSISVGAGARIAGSVTGIQVGGTTAATVTNQGTIAGSGKAIAFGAGNDRLILVGGAAFAGVVDGGGGTNTLELRFGPAGTISGLGSSVVNFSTVFLDPTSSWTLAGSNTLAAGSSVAVNQDSTMTVTGSLLAAGSVNVSAGTIGLTGTASALFSSLALNSGVLNDLASGPVVVGSALAGAAAGVLTVQAGANLSGFGSITGASVVDNGTVTSQGGVLSVGAALSGTGVVLINGAGSSFGAGSSLSVASVQFATGGAETLLLAGPAQVTSVISGFSSGDLIDLVKTAATTATFAGGTLTVSNGSTVVSTLKFSGTYTNTNFVLSSDGQGGTNIGFAALPLARYPDLAPGLGLAGGAHPDQAGHSGSAPWSGFDPLHGQTPDLGWVASAHGLFG